MEEVPRAHPSRTLLYAYCNRSGSKGALAFPGATWDRFRCAVEPSHVIFGVDFGALQEGSAESLPAPHTEPQRFCRTLGAKPPFQTLQILLPLFEEVH